MATAVAPRNDLYLSVLAGRAVTALADLAGNPLVWNERVENGLRDGIVYCQVLRLPGGRFLARRLPEARNPLKRSVEHSLDSATWTNVQAESKRVEDFLTRLVSREYRPEIRELALTIEFLRKTATGR
jgi:hypothetical protein